MFPLNNDNDGISIIYIYIHIHMYLTNCAFMYIYYEQLLVYLCV